MTYVLRVTESKVSRTEATETGARCNDPARRCIPTNLWDELMKKEAIIAQMALYTLVRMYISIPACVVNAVRTENLYQSLLYKPFSRFDQLEVLRLIITAKSGWKNHYGLPLGTKSENVYVVSQVMGIEFR